MLACVSLNPLKRSDGSLFIALLALSFAAIFIKLSEQEISAISTVFNRLWISAILLGGWSWGEKLKAPTTTEHDTQKLHLEEFPQTREIVLLLLVGIIGTLSVLCWAWSLRNTSVANSTLMRNLSPLFTCILGWMFFQKQFNAQFIGSLCLAIFGALLIGIGDIQLGVEHFVGDGLGLLAAVFYALNLLILEMLRPRFSATRLLFWRCTIGAIALLPLMGLHQDTVFPRSPQGWLIVIALAILCQCLGQSILVHNLKYFSSSFLALVLLLEPALTAFLGWIIFSEALSPLNALGFLIVLAGIFLARSSQNTGPAGECLRNT